MVRTINVTASHKLSRLYVHSTPIRFHGIEAPSVEAIFDYILLCQVNRGDLARRMLRNRDLMREPGHIRPWYEGKGVKPSADFIFAAPDIYQDILMYQLVQNDSPIRAELMACLKKRKNHRKVRFRVFTCTQERVLTLGVQQSEFKEDQKHNLSLGYNKYGKALKYVAKNHFKRRIDYVFPGEKLVSDNIADQLFSNHDHTKTVGLFADSFCRNVKSIQGGAVFSLSGGTYDDIADEIIEQNIQLSDYQYIVFECGLNVAQRMGDNHDPKCIDRLGQLLTDEAKRRGRRAQILFSAPFWVPGVRITEEQLEQHVEMLTGYFKDTGVLVFDWFEQDYNPFTEPDTKERVERYVDFEDGFHLSHHGFRLMWHFWQSYLAQLDRINYKLDTKSRAILPLRKRGYSDLSRNANTGYRPRGGSTASHDHYRSRGDSRITNDQPNYDRYRFRDGSDHANDNYHTYRTSGGSSITFAPRYPISEGSARPHPSTAADANDYYNDCYGHINDKKQSKTFLLGFFVAVITKRWWDIFLNIPRVEKIGVLIATYVHGSDERGRTIRRNLCRYQNLIGILCLRNVSTAVRKRFPTIDHLVEANLLSKDERRELESVNQQYGNYYVPASWFGNLAIQARREGRIYEDVHLVNLMNELSNIRAVCGKLICYDWVSVPLVYSQVVSLSLYSFFLASLFGRQYLDISRDDKYFAVRYFPFFTFMQFFFYMGWLKVAQVMINPLGEDDDDFEVNSLIDRNVTLGYILVDGLYGKFPDQNRDPHWDEEEPTVPYTQGTRKGSVTPYLGSAANVRVPENDRQWLSLEKIPEAVEEEEENSEIIGSNESPLSRLNRTSSRFSESVLHESPTLLNRVGSERSSFCSSSYVPLSPSVLSVNSQPQPIEGTNEAITEANGHVLEDGDASSDLPLLCGRLTRRDRSEEVQKYGNPINGSSRVRKEDVFV